MFDSRRLCCLCAASAVFLFALLNPRASYAQFPAPDDACAPASPAPPGVSVEISLEGTQSEFHEGEIIPVTVRYSTTTHHEYRITNRNYDRSGRLVGLDNICLTPSAGTDPLEDYFDGDDFMGGGIFNESFLDEAPLTVHLELNEWITLPPGDYQLRIGGSRVSVAQDKDDPNKGAEGEHAILSNEVRFTVAPASPVWSAQTLAEAVATLNSADPVSDDAHHAARVIRFLNTDAATREMARRYWSGNDTPDGWEWRLGLYNPAHREAAIDEMKMAVGNVSHPVTQSFLYVLADLEVRSDPKYKLPPRTPGFFDERDYALNKRDAALEKIVVQLRMEAAAAVLKEPANGGAEAAELLGGSAPLPEPLRTLLLNVLISDWAALPPTKQRDILWDGWHRVASSAWAPVLRATVAGPAALANTGSGPSRGLALYRLYQISPGDGRELLLREIENPRGGVSFITLGMLPDKEIPQLDAHFLSSIQVKQPSELDYQLLDRYASAAIYPQVKAVYESNHGHWHCAPQHALLRYIARVKPDDAAAAVREALYTGDGAGCYRDAFTGLAEAMRAPAMEKVAIDALDNSNLTIASDAAIALGKYGSADAEAKLWARLEKLGPPPRKKSANDTDSQQDTPEELRSRLVDAILKGNAWLTRGAALERLEAMADESEHDQFSSLVDEWNAGRFPTLIM
jgi:hypothetical protein